MRTAFPDTWILSGYQYMPMGRQEDSYMMRMVNLFGGSIFPLSLCMLLPLFLHNVVLEKEQRLIEIMKMNGLRMSNYWIATLLSNLAVYIFTVVVFVFFGAFILRLRLFMQTNVLILVRQLATHSLP